MDFNPTGSFLRYDTGSMPTICHQLGFAGTSQCTPSVFIVDGDRAVCESLALLIACEGWRPETFTSAEEFLCRPLELVPSCLMLDVSLPGISGLELQKRVAAERPDIPIIFISTKSDVPTTVQAMKAGAVEFFTKPFRDEELLGAIREALKRSRVAIAQEKENRALKARYASLSFRERQVMALVSSGLLNKQVGSELGISEITVKAHRGQVMHKMRAASLADLVKMAARLSVTKNFEMPMPRDIADCATHIAGHLIGSYTPAALEAVSLRQTKLPEKRTALRLVV
ncbi:MAG: response regulator [Terracidiphilus sp.]